MKRLVGSLIALGMAAGLLVAEGTPVAACGWNVVYYGNSAAVQVFDGNQNKYTYVRFQTDIGENSDCSGWHSQIGMLNVTVDDGSPFFVQAYIREWTGGYYSENTASSGNFTGHSWLYGTSHQMGCSDPCEWVSADNLNSYVWNYYFAPHSPSAYSNV